MKNYNLQPSINGKGNDIKQGLFATTTEQVTKQRSYSTRKA